MLKHSVFIALLTMCMSLAGYAQAPEGIAPETNINQNGYPRIMPGNRVAFEVKAPEAQNVQINLGRMYDMDRDDQGVWRVTTDPQDPGFHYYSLVVDGVSVADPASESYYGTSRMSSAIDIPEPGADFYTVKDVPHGAIRSKRYYSDYTGSWRRLFVYTPPGYDTNTGTRYPVMYIQHGGGEDERGWAQQGKTDIILDNLIAEGGAVPMLVVISNGNVPSLGGGRGNSYSIEGMAGFKEELINNIVPFIERTYRVVADADHRALCGLSMGGGQAFYVGVPNADVFGSVGVFSTGLFGGIGMAAGGEFDGEAHIPGLFSEVQSFNDKLDLFYISCGEQDPRIEYTKQAVASFREHGLDVEFASFPGSHEWQPWRKSLRDFASRVFK